MTAGSESRWGWAVASISGVIACGFVAWLAIAHQQAMATIDSLRTRNEMLYNEVVAMRRDAQRHYQIANEMAVTTSAVLDEIDAHTTGKDRLVRAIMGTYGWTPDQVEAIYFGELDPFDPGSRPAGKSGRAGSDPD